MSIPKVLLYTSKTNSDNTHPIVIRWYENGKPKKRTVANVLKEQWNDKASKVNKKHPFAEQINEKINDMLGEAIVHGGLEKKVNQISLVDFIKEEADRSRVMGQLSTKNGYAQLAADIISFNKKSVEWGFDDFTESHAEKLYVYLREKNNLNTSSRKMSRLGTVFKRAKKLKLTVNDPTFGMTFPKERVIKTKLTKEEFAKIENLDDEGIDKWMRISRDVTILQYYLRGARVGDVLTLTSENVQENRIVYRESKTGQIRNITLRPEVVEIIEKYKGKSEFIIPALKFIADKYKSSAENMLILKKSIESTTQLINRALSRICIKLKITKHVTTHTFRHTFAKHAIDKLKNPRVSQELVGHRSLRVHQDYIRDLEDSDELDQAADDVFGD